MTGRRVATTEAHDPRGARNFRALTIAFFACGLGFVALTGGWLLADLRISHRVALAALGGLVSGVFCVVAAAFCVDAIDGPPARDDEDHVPDPWDAGERLPAEETS